jgi:sulfatase modifying factor 1
MMEIDLVRIDGGIFTMGSDTAYPEEAPARTVEVETFQIGQSPITNRQFSAFVDSTGYRTVAERMRSPSSLVFRATPGPVDLRDWTQWWEVVGGAAWNRPTGPGSSVDDLLDHPAVHIAYDDARALATWAGCRLPTEAEWEYAWGRDLRPGGRLMANTWQGQFPYANQGADGWIGTSPVGSFPANDRGLYDMIGNVWEWTSDQFSIHVLPTASCCGVAPTDPLAPRTVDGVLKGGSHLCAAEYCRRYRPSARSAHARDSGSSHIGFRVARDV